MPKDFRNKTCCFTGHRNIDLSLCDPIISRLEDNIVDLINKGVTYYASGGARGFDAVAARTVLDLKKSYPKIKLIMVLPSPDYNKLWGKSDIDSYYNIYRCADKIKYISPFYTEASLMQRNRCLVENSGFLIGYCNKTYGGTLRTMNYALRQGLSVFNIADLGKH